jgi:hypothetical protein
MQELAKTGARLAPAAMPPAGAVCADQPGPRQGLFDEAVGQLHLMLAPHDLGEMAHIKSAIPLAVEPQDPLDLRDRHPPRGRGPLAAIDEPVIAARLVLMPRNVTTLLVSTVFAALIAFAALRIDGLFAWIAALLTAGWIAQAARRHIGGVTGDVFGASVELTETAVLLSGVLVTGRP